MERAINIYCPSCDYREQCSKKINVGGHKVLAKDQDVYPMNCLNVLQDLCRDCDHYKTKSCASWKILNGKRTGGILRNCPKKKGGRISGSQV